MCIIGTTRSGKAVALTEKERARHTHVIGGIGTGKSKLLEHMIRQEIVSKGGLVLIDPHGTLVENLEHWAAITGVGNFRRIHVLKPGDPKYVPGFNPLRVSAGEDLSVRVDAMVAACAQVWGVADMSATPRLEKTIWALLFALGARNLTLAEAPAVLQSHDPDGLRRLITDALPNPMPQITWDELNRMPRKEFAEHVESTNNRLARFLNAPAMRTVVGQTRNVVDFRSAMDNGDVVLVNLAAQSQFSYENARVLGSMMVTDLFLSSFGRSEEMALKRPFTLYIDEAYDFLSGDIERILDQSRKFGLRAVLAHQRIEQLKKRGESVYNAVMGGTQTKIVLGGLADDDAEIMTREIMRGDIDLEKPKRGLDMPVVVDEVPFWLESESEGHSHGVSFGSTFSRGTVASAGISTSNAQNYSATQWTAPQLQGIAAMTGEFAATAQSEGYAYTEAVTQAYSQSRGRTQTLKPVRQWRHTAYYSLDECFHLAQVRIRELPDRYAIVKRRGMSTVQIKTVAVPPVLKAPAIVARFRDKCAQRSPFVIDAGTAKAEVEGRLRAGSGSEQSQDEESFWHEETAT